MERENIDLERGDDEIVFVQLEDDLDTSEIINKAEDPRMELEEELSSQGLEWENARIAAIFKDEISLHLEEDAKIFIDGERVSTDEG